MQILEFGAGTLRFLEQAPARSPDDGFVWIILDREDLPGAIAELQVVAQRLGGSPLLDLHLKDLANPAHPSHHDATSVYDLVVFRRLATAQEVDTGTPPPAKLPPGTSLASFRRIQTRAVAFAVFDRLLVTVQPAGCRVARSFQERLAADAVQSEGVVGATRARRPTSPADLMLRMVNMVVDSYLDLRKQLSTEMTRWQDELLRAGAVNTDWSALMMARSQLHYLEDLCEEQHDAIQEWLDTAREQPPPGLTQAELDALVARANDVIEHIRRVEHQVRGMEQGAEMAVQIHFSAQSHRMNVTVRTLTALTAVFLPLNLITGIFGMNFEHMPLLKDSWGFWLTLGMMAGTAIALAAVFWRKRYLARSGR